MPLLVSSIAQICKSLSQYLGIELNSGGGSTVHVLLGTPAEAVQGESDMEHRCNLFFFRFEPSAFEPSMLPGETSFLRMYCLITPFATSENSSTSAGENDLRLIGEVLRIFHEKPVFELTAGRETFHIQMLFQSLDLDQLNQLWSTQGDTIYRPSVLFEVALTPVIPNEKAISSPLSGSLGLEVHARMEAVSSSITAESPPVPVVKPNTLNEAWAPAICLVRAGECVQTLSLALGSPELAGFSPQVWVVGEIGSEVQLRWELWDPVTGWETMPTTMSATISEQILDPGAVAGATLTTLSLPFDNKAGQMVLYAEREYTRASDDALLTLRSNPLLISLYEVTA